MINYPENDLPAMLASQSEVCSKRMPKAGADRVGVVVGIEQVANGRWPMVSG